MLDAGQTADPRAGFTGIDRERPEGSQRLRCAGASETEELRQTINRKRAYKIRSSPALLHRDSVGSVGRLERGNVQRQKAWVTPATRTGEHQLLRHRSLS